MPVPQVEAIFFGGTFDPPHMGHRGCVLAALRSFPRAKVYIVPAFIPPEGGGAIKEPSAAFTDRVKMAELNFQALGVPPGQLEVSALEAELATPSYTWQTLKALREKSGLKRWALLIGEDQLENFHRWSNACQLLSEVDVLVAGRRAGALPRTTGLRDQVQGLSQNLGLVVNELSPALFQWQQSGKYVIWIAEQISPAASRLLRSEQGDESAPQSSWLSDEVKAYIRSRGLYSRAQDDKGKEISKK